nr:H510 [uncultured bacterium]
MLSVQSRKVLLSPSGLAKRYARRLLSFEILLTRLEALRQSALRPNALAAVGLLIVLLTFLTWGIPDRQDGLDDAFITFRYAENIANGDGFVFNPGDEAIQGTSTPLYTGILAGGAVLGMDLAILSQIIGTLATAASGVLLVLIGKILRYPFAGAAAGLLWAGSPFTSEYLSGMETPLYVALMLSAFLAAFSGSIRLSLTLSALVALTRLDGLAVLAVVACYHTLQERRLPAWRELVPALVVLGAWLSYAFIQFGSPLPASGVAKLVHGEGVAGGFDVLSEFFMRLAAPFVAFERLTLLGLGLAVLVAPVAIMRHGPPRRDLGLLGAWLTLYFAGYIILNPPEFAWYYGPPAVVASFLAWALFERLAGRASFVLPALALLILVFVAIGHRRDAPYDSTYDDYWVAGAWLREHSDEDDIIAAYEIGIIGYVSDRKIVDILGLTEPSARPYIAKGDFGWAVRELEPDFVFAHAPADWPVTDAIYSVPGFDEAYRLVARYQLVPRFPALGVADYLLFERRTTE